MINILIIDDEELNLRIIEESLEGSGYILTKAIDGSQAWEILKKKKVEFAAIILDRLMPVMDGIEVLKLIKSDRDLREIPVVLQTALSGNKDIIDGLESGAFYYLTKPYSKKVLISITNLAVEGYFKYKKAREDLKLSQNVLKYIKNGEFYIKNFDHVLALAPVLSNAFPEPSRVLTGIMEIMHNAIEHGNLEIGYELKKRITRYRQI
ncbi:response regulator [Leptospira sp. GIMC2001]|uniref:response regulator n=1 Tax=Leptospira sp. GIMC2001 TaxID=1513297 RepID=UPI002349B661|nr:response regulator [Leptospira sp. GIMC2001]WCL49271.1 response regulator [Leptospira sp. GIMC2001]